MNHRFALTAALLAVGLAACSARKVDSGSTASASTACTHCHGGGDNQTGAPPVDTSGRSDTTLRSVGAHTAHVVSGPVAGAFDCSECHVKPTSPSTHAQPGGSKLRWGAMATNGGATTPSFDGTRCSNVYCHGAFDGGNRSNAPVWTSVGSGGAACGTCHGIPPPFPHVVVSDLTKCAACHPETMDATGAIIPATKGGKHVDGTVQASGHDQTWMDTSSPGFHAYAADANIASCTRCHGAQLDGGTVNVACTQCHVPGGAANAFTCTGCHGGTDNTTGAPPRGIWGAQADPIAIGAHTAHVTASPISPAFDCGVCHVKPTDALSPGHVDGTPTVAFDGVAKAQGASPTWSAGAATCASTYCHGNFDGGNRATPLWTGGAAQATCGSCHGTPPPAPHPVATDLTQCNGCHPATMDASGQIIPPAQGGKHLDGIVEAQGHPASWMDQTSPGFHAYSADLGIAACQSCHGQDLSGGVVKKACADCHMAGGVANPFTTCTACHGGADNQTGAPPRTTWGQSADTVRVGAHSAHIAGSSMAPGFACVECHVTPTDMFSAGHIDGPRATVTFGDLAVKGAAAPKWDVATAKCSSTYCHGATLNGGNNTSPTWTGGSGQAVCGSCHGVPPLAPHPTASLTQCNTCHPGTVDASGNLIPPASGGKHLDGVIEAVGGHDASWIDPSSPNFHAFTADTNIQSCTQCHGADLSTCAQCHTAGGPAKPFTTCTACHGGTDNQTGAPPAAIWGHAGDPSRGGGTLDPVRVGAHTTHVTGSNLAPAFDCTVCHVKPTDPFSAGHIDGNTTATVTFGGLAVNGTSLLPTWTRTSATCSNTYCHGATLAGGNNTTPVWTGTNQAACGSCHGVPPLAPHPTATLQQCNGCHPDTVDASGNVIPPSSGGKHLDGTIEAIGGHPSDWMDQTSPGFHAFSADRGLQLSTGESCTQCHGADLSTCTQCHKVGGAANAFTCTGCHGGTDNQTGAPPRTIWGQSADTIRVGAHTAHVTAGALRTALDCSECHVKPTDMFSAGHIDVTTGTPTATVTWSALATGNIAPAANFTSTPTSPTWDRATGTCSSTYCHGGYSGTFAYNTLDGNGDPVPATPWSFSGLAAAPSWTGTAACGSCHGVPPKGSTWHSGAHAGGNDCSLCHPDASGTAANATITNPALHVDGKVDLAPKWTSTCFTCH
jgi:predicted CxxxxCH...CXXCH cytochrome family protein